MNKPIHPAVAEHVMEENERLRGLLREVIACQAAHYGDGTGLHLAMITLADRLKGALSQQAEPVEPALAQDELSGRVCGGDAQHNTVNVVLDNPAPWEDLRIGSPVKLAALAAQGPKP